jgi:cytochrome c-type biogenesis protein CcmH/NrfF
MNLGARAIHAALLLAIVAGALPLPAQAPSPEPSAGMPTGHGERGAPQPLLELTDDQLRLRMKRLQGQVMCACPDENFSRTLANCPDGCADPQKSAIRAQVMSGWPDDRIIAAQIAEHGPRVRAHPGWSGAGKWAIILPFAALAGGAWFAGRVIRRWRAAGAEERARRQRSRAGTTPEEIARIERDLESIE